MKQKKTIRHKVLLSSTWRDARANLAWDIQLVVEMKKVAVVYLLTK